MNKAFLKEDESGGQGRCPLCDGAGVPVGKETLDAFVRREGRREIADTAFYCPTPHCDAVYFDVFERVIRHEELTKPVYPKDPEAPMCGCFGLTRDDIEADIREGTPTRVRSLLAKARSDAARCVVCNVSGQTCVPDVQRYYMKHRNG